MNGAITNGSQVRLRRLDVRRDGDEWIVGHRFSGEYIAVPGVAVAVMSLLNKGLTVDDVHRRILRKHDEDIDVAEFVGDLVDVGFVASIDDHNIPMTRPKISFPSVKPANVRWAVSPIVGGLFGLVIGLGLLQVVLTPTITPRYSDLFWSPYGGMVLLGNAILGWSLIFLHELAHLFTARAYGAPGRISLSTRLQFLVAQTDVSGIWSAPRRSRIVVYLSGTLLDLVVASVALLARAQVDHDGTFGKFFGAIAIITLAAIPYQFLVFMRTDVYYVLLEATRSRNLYADGSAYVRWFFRRSAKPDPSLKLAKSEPCGASLRVFSRDWNRMLRCLCFCRVVAIHGFVSE